MYIQTFQDGSFARSFGDFEQVWDDTHQCKPSALTLEERELFRVYPLSEIQAGPCDPLRQYITSSIPELIDGVWTKTYIVEDLPLEQQQTNIKNSIIKQISELEAEQLMPRATREFMLLFMEANFTAEMLALNIGYQAVKAFDYQIAALRTQLV